MQEEGHQLFSPADKASDWGAGVVQGVSLYHWEEILTESNELSYEGGEMLTTVRQHFDGDNI